MSVEETDYKAEQEDGGRNFRGARKGLAEKVTFESRAFRRARTNPTDVAGKRSQAERPVMAEAGQQQLAWTAGNPRGRVE